MATLEEFNKILDRVTSGKQTEADIVSLRQLLSAGNERDVVQLGKNIVNIGQGKDIHIGDRNYQGADAETIRELLQDVLQEYQLLPDKPEPPAQVWRYLHTFRGHAGAVNALVIAPDGRTLISGGDNTINFWRLGTMQFLRELPKGQKPVTKLALSSDGQTLLSGSEGGAVKIWQMITGELLDTLWGIHAGAITALGISSNGQTLVTASTDRTIKIWNLQTKEAIQTLPSGNTFVNTMAISPDRPILVTGSQGGTLKFWDFETGELLHILAGAHGGSINALVIRSEPQQLITGSSDQTIKIWDFETQELLHTLAQGKTPVISMAISQDSRTFVSGSEGGTAKFWDLQTRELLYILTKIHKSAINAIAISPDGQTCVTGSEGGTIKVWRK